MNYRKRIHALRCCELDGQRVPKEIALLAKLKHPHVSDDPSLALD